MVGSVFNLDLSRIKPFFQSSISSGWQPTASPAKAIQNRPQIGRQLQASSPSSSLELTSPHSSPTISTKRVQNDHFVACSPPPTPLPWMWKCHVCHSTYPLGVTRRCLYDGHYFCSVPTITKNRRTGRVKKHRPCRSRFDYDGWKQCAEWRRTQTDVTILDPTAKDCWNGCDYPSECRWSSHSEADAHAKENVKMNSGKDRRNPNTEMVTERNDSEGAILKRRKVKRGTENRNDIRKDPSPPLTAAEELQ